MLNDKIQAFRLQMPRYEREHPWLSSLLDCHATIDFSVDKAITESTKKVVCHKGCSTCCSQPIPLSVIESIGIKFYVNTLLDRRSRLLIVDKFNEHGNVCIFNIDDICIIYPMRPISCRRYIFTSQCCGIDEDPATTRPNDMIEPSRRYLDDAIALTLPFYKNQNIYPQNNEHIFDFYKRHNIIMSEIYSKII